MSDTTSGSDLDETAQIFAVERQEIRRRRETLNLGCANITSVPTQPSADMGLVGLSISGGGIRSAVFSLGIIQGLARYDYLKHIDYLSTVSGGGFTGACISSLLRDASQSSKGRQFPLRPRAGNAEPPAVTHLRNSSNYLIPGGLLDRLRLPALVLRGIFLNLVLFLPFIAIAVFVTEVVYETSLSSSHLPSIALGLVVFFFVAVFLFAVAVRLFRPLLNWQRRNTLEKSVGIPLLLAVTFIVAIPMTWVTQWCIEQSLEQALSYFGELFKNYGLAVALAGLFIAGLLVLASKVSENISRLVGRAVIFLVGLLGPLVIAGIYLFLCLWQIDLPYLSGDSFKAQLNTAVECGKPLKYCLPNERSTDNLLYALEGRRLTPLDVGEFKVAQPCKRHANGWSLQNKGVETTCITEKTPSMLLIRDPGDEIFAVFDGFRDKSLAVMVIVLGVILRFVLDVNITSPHSFYRDRLSKAFLFNVDSNGTVAQNDNLKLSQLNQDGSAAPYHLINATLNLQADSDPGLRGRNAGFFVFSKHYVGGEQSGYCKTDDIEKYDPHLDLGTAMAISGAAAAPNMGATTIKPLVFILTLLNIRLGYWLPNPERVKRHPMKVPALNNAWAIYVLKEAMGMVDANDARVNVSDGAHIENLGLYALLQRRCKFILAIDGEADPAMSFEGLIKVMRLARIDLGVEFDLDISGFEKQDGIHSKQQWALGKIDYGNGETGEILYLKLSLNGDEPIYLDSYREQNTVFPHQPTADQFFDEEQFEAYRALGEYIVDRVFEDPSPVADFLLRMKSANPEQQTKT